MNLAGTNKDIVHKNRKRSRYSI